MSNFSSTHAISLNADGKAVPLSGQRLATCWWKLTQAMKDAGKKEVHAPVAVSIPKITTLSEIELETLMPHIVGMLEGVQDKIIRGLVDSKDATEVSDSEISVAACISYLNQESISNRLTKEKAAEWFNANIAEMLSVALADKLGISDTPTPEQLKKLEQSVNGVREMITPLVSAKTTYSEDKAKKLIGVLRYAPAGDLIAAKFIERLEGMGTKQQADLMDLL